MTNLTPVFLILVALPLCLAVDQGSTKISTTRNALRTTVCDYYSANFTDSERKSTQPLIDSYKFLTDQQIEGFIFQDKLPALATDSILLVLPHCIGVVILILMWPGLICCCARPEKYPVCKSCRKPEKEMFTKCELKWPAYVTVLTYLLIVIGSAAALSGGPDITNYYSNIGCKLMSVADDTLYGRISPTDDSTFFVGIVPLSSELLIFQGDLTTYFTDANTSLNNSQSIRAKQVGIESQIDGEYSSFVGDTYTSAFRESDGTTYISVDSQFKELYYGPVSDSTKILGNIKTQLAVIFEQVNEALDPMIDAWVYLEAQTETVVDGRITDTITSISSHETQLNATIAHYETYDDPDTYTSYNYGIKILYGMILALALLGLISAIILTCFTVVRVRLVIYCTCAMLYFIGVITFALIISLGFLIPNVSQFCSYADEKLTTSAGINSLFTSLEFNSSAVLYKDCYGDGTTGDMLININSAFQPDFQAMDVISDQTLQFNDLIPNFNSANFLKPFTEAGVVIQQVKECEILEINDTTAIEFLNGVAKKIYSRDVTCQGLQVAADSWVPTRDVVSCQSGSFSQPVCNDLSDVNVCPSGCYEAYWELNDPQGDPDNYVTHLGTRYGTPCNYADFIIQLHENWADPRVAKMYAVQTNIDNIKLAVDDYDLSMKTIQASLNTFKSNLETNFDSETNLTSGSFNGVDCRVVGETIQELRDSVCVGLLYSMNYNYTMLAIISYSILLLGCFSVSSGVRHYQHLQRMQVKVGYKGVPVAVSSNRIIDKFDS